jgi:ribosomal protein S18 acetylase RimI-like enzyme
MQLSSENLIIEQIDREDLDLVQGLLDGASWQHRHLDWSLPSQLLGQEPFLMATQGGLPIGLLACPPDPPGAAWIRLLAVSSGYDVNALWQALWVQARQCLQELPVQKAAALAIPPWLPALLEASKFSQIDSVQFLEWTGAEIPETRQTEAVIEPLLATNLAAVADLDERAFDLLWRHSLEALQQALKYARYASIIRLGGRVAGYQISTASQHGGHLARLAIDPQFQGQGLASLLVIDLLDYFKRHGFQRITVNTQGSNQRSQALYQRLGFHSLNQEFPVFSVPIG